MLHNTRMRKSTLALTAILAIASISVPHFPAMADGAGTTAPVDSQPIPIPPAPAGTVSPLPATGPAAALPTVDPSTANIASRLSTTLNPALNPTDSMIQDDIAAGRQMGLDGKDLIDVLNIGSKGFAFKPGGILKQLRRPVAVVYFITPGIEARWRGFLENKQLATDAARTADFEAVRDHVISANRSLTFVVELDDLVKDTSDGSAPETTDDALKKVDGTRFVLSDDKDTNYDPITVPTAPLLETRRQFFEAFAADPDAVIQATSTDDLPKSSSTPSWSGLIKKRNGYNNLSAFYLVSFNAFNSEGTARIGRDNASFTLHVLGPDGQRWVQYKLVDLP